MIQLVSFVGYSTQHSSAFILQNYQAPYEQQASRRDLVHAERTVYHAGRYFTIIHHFYRSDLVHLTAN